MKGNAIFRILLPRYARLAYAAYRKDDGARFAIMRTSPDFEFLVRLMCATKSLAIAYGIAAMAAAASSGIMAFFFMVSTVGFTLLYIFSEDKVYVGVEAYMEKYAEAMA